MARSHVDGVEAVGALDAVVFMIFSLNGERCTSSSRETAGDLSRQHPDADCHATVSGGTHRQANPLHWRAFLADNRISSRFVGMVVALQFYDTLVRPATNSSLQL